MSMLPERKFWKTVQIQCPDLPLVGEKKNQTSKSNEWSLNHFNKTNQDPWKPSESHRVQIQWKNVPSGTLLLKLFSRRRGDLLKQNQKLHIYTIMPHRAFFFAHTWTSTGIFPDTHVLFTIRPVITAHLKSGDLSLPYFLNTYYVCPVAVKSTVSSYPGDTLRRIPSNLKNPSRSSERPVVTVM